MTALTDTQIVTASGGLVELGSVIWATTPTIDGTGVDGTASSFATPLTISFVSDGGPVLVDFSAREQTTGANASGSESYVALFLDGVFQRRLTRVQTSGTTSVAQTCFAQARLTPSAGSHTVELKQFRVNANGSIGPGYATVSKVVSATQWPAATTGTIVCTSSTRPASPFVGQSIYETDAKQQLIWNGTSWVAPQVVSEPPSVRANPNSSTTLTTGNLIKVAFGGADSYDTDAMHDPASNNTRITINTPGLYIVHSKLTVTGTPTNYQEHVLLLNNTTRIHQNGYGGTLSGTTTATALYNFALNDYIEVAYYHTTGSSLGVNTTADQTFFSATLIGTIP